MTRALANGFVYFIANFEADVVKIGFATDLKMRLHSIQTGNHVDLTLIYHFRGCKRSERLLHKHFAKDRVRREWFTHTNEIDDLIEDIERYRDHWIGGAGWPDEYVMHHDETAFVLRTTGEPWALPIKSETFA